MLYKRWIYRFILISILVSILIFIVNFIIDPYGLNNDFKIEKINIIKKRLDERVQKFDYLKNNKNYEAVILGASRATYIDPVFVENYTGLKTYNAGFSAGTMDEFFLYIDWLSKNRSIKLIILDFDYYALTNYKSNGVMPKELSKKNFFDYMDYFNSRMFFDSITTMEKNFLDNNRFFSIEKKKYEDKGMRYDEEYFKRFNSLEKQKRHINMLHLSKNKLLWPGEHISVKRINYLKKISTLCKDKGIKLILIVTPSSYLLLEKFAKSKYVDFLFLLRKLVSLDDIYFFNNFNAVNYNLNLFLDNYHFDYRVGKLIVDRIFDENKTFGVKLTTDNIDKVVDDLKSYISQHVLSSK